MTLLTDERRLMMWGGEAHTPLAFAMGFAAGFWIDRPVVWILSWLATGLAVFSTTVKSFEARGGPHSFSFGVARIAFYGSWVAGVAAFGIAAIVSVRA